MDPINVIRIAFTLISFAFFIGVVAWVFSAKAKKGLDEAAQLPFQD